MLYVSSLFQLVDISSFTHAPFAIALFLMLMLCKDTAIFFKHQKQKDRSLQKTVKKRKL